MTSAAPYEPTLPQMLFGNPWSEFEMPEYAEALFEAILNDIERVAGNQGRSWDRWGDPEIPGVAWNDYYWGDDDAEAAKPNFVFGEVEIRWYKRPGRGLSANVDWEPSEWVSWFDRCIAAIRAHDPLDRGTEGTE